MELDDTTVEARRMAEIYTKYLHDPTVYPITMPPIRINHTAMKKEEERKLSIYWKTIEPENIKSTVYSFKVPEPAKQRCRVVHSCAINEAAKQAANAPPSYKLRTPAEVNRILAMAEKVVQYDAVSMYDQFPLSEEISRYFAFRTRNGTTAALSRMPMGFVHSCGIAQSLSILLAEFKNDHEHYYVYIIIHLDNYCFAFVRKENATPSPQDLKTAVVKTIKKFLQRTISTDLQLNEMNREEILEWLQMEHEAQWSIINNMSPQKFTFLGVQYDLHERTKTAGEKSWEKLHLLMRCLFPEGRMNPATTPRQLAMLVGTLNYVKRNVECRHLYLNLHRNLSELAYVLWVYPQAWDIALAPITFMFSEIVPLYEIIKEKKTSRIYPQQANDNETLIIITDASHIGWGGIVCYPQERRIQVHAARWPQIGGQVDPLYESSVVAEPQAIKETLQAHGVPAHVKHITIVTDHSPLVSAAKSYQARSYNYFKLLEWLEKQDVTYSVLFIPGEMNIADKPSRNPDDLSINEIDAWEICRAAGVGYARALLNPSEILPSVCASTDADVLSLLS